MLPFLQQGFGLFEENLSRAPWLEEALRPGSLQFSTHPLLPRLPDVFVGFEQRPDVRCLATPDVAVDGPVKGQFQTTSVE